MQYTGQMRRTDLLAVELQLAHHPIFADPDRIIARRRETYYLYLEALAFEDAKGPWGSILKWPTVLLDRFVDTPAARSILNEWFRAKKCTNGLSFATFLARKPRLKSFSDWVRADCETIAVDLSMGKHVSGLDSWRGITYFDPARLPNWIVERTRSVYMDEIGGDLGHADSDVAQPSPQAEAKIWWAIQALSSNLPILTRSLFQHVSQVAWIPESRGREAFDGASSDSLPGVIFGMPRSSASPWSYVEIIFHEACHQKMFDVIATNAIYRPGYSSDTAARLTAPWRREKSGCPAKWHIDRALLAAHVYVYLAYLTCRILANPDPWDGFDVDSFSGHTCSLFRARYLVENLIALNSADIACRGIDLLKWLRETLTMIEGIGFSIGLENEMPSLKQI